MRLKDKNLWDSLVIFNDGEHGVRIMKYAEDWARFMQKEIDKGILLCQCAESTSCLADYDGISGSMYEFTCNILYKCWEHGEDFKKWKNNDK